jgi:hypothetical protein
MTHYLISDFNTIPATLEFSDDVEFDEKSEEFVKLLLVPELSKN